MNRDTRHEHLFSDFPFILYVSRFFSLDRQTNAELSLIIAGPGSLTMSNFVSLPVHFSSDRQTIFPNSSTCILKKKKSFNNRRSLDDTSLLRDDVDDNPRSGTRARRTVEPAIYRSQNRGDATQTEPRAVVSRPRSINDWRPDKLGSLSTPRPARPLRR